MFPSSVQNCRDSQHRAALVPRVAVVGAGFVGATTAYALLMSGTAAEIVLIDRDRKRAEGQVDDLRDATLFSPYAKVFAGDLSDCRDADVTIITAGASQTPDVKSRLDNLTGERVHSQGDRGRDWAPQAEHLAGRL